MDESTFVTGPVASPYGDRSLAKPSPQASWRGASLALLVLSLVLFLSAAVTLTVAVARIVLTLNQNTGADIGVGLMLIVFITFVLSACGVLRLGHCARRG